MKIKDRVPQVDEHGRLKIMFGIIGCALGLIAGLSLSIALSGGGIFILTVTVLVGAIGTAGGIWFDGFIRSDFIRSSEPRFRHDRFAAVFGAIVGFALAGNIPALVHKGWFTIPLAMLVCAIAVALIWNAIERAYKARQLTPAQLNVPVGNSYVSERKLKSVRRHTKVDNKIADKNEQEVRVVTEWHWMMLASNWAFPIVVQCLLFWGSRDFDNYQQVWKYLTSGGYRPWMLAGAVIFFIVYWFLKNRKRLIRKTTIPLIVGLLFLWGWRGFPGVDFLGDIFKSGKPEPWYIAMLLCGVWMLWRWAKWKFGFLKASDKRITVGYVFPFPIPNPEYNTPLNKVQTCDPKDSFLGNLLGYGKLEIDTAGQLDWFFNDLRYVKKHRVFSESVSVS